MARSDSGVEGPEAAGIAGPDPLSLFHPVVACWFRRRFGQPSPPQALGWPHIAAGRHVLIAAPTGSGKTLAAFLKGLDALWQEALAGPVAPGVRLLYVSPLRALSADIQRNLREPLAGVQEEAAAAGLAWPQLRVAVRTGDTGPAERERMRRQPPDVLITTPESLYLLLTSARARELLRPVRYVIVDELHALLESKRGAHLAVSLERLEALAERPPLRIGLSATVRPLSLAARFLGGQGPDGRPRPVQVCDAGMARPLDLRVEVPVDDMGHLPDGSLWPALTQRLLELVRAHRSTLVFVNYRRAAERLAARLNQLAGEEVALAHHGSLSRAQRRYVEERLKAGELPCLVATASLELGIDVGAVDLVVQVQSPQDVARGLQRVGRAGHSVGGVSQGRLLPTNRADLLEAAAAARLMRRGEIEPARTADLCLDVLAQQVAAMVAVEPWTVDRLHALLRQAYPYRHLSRRQLEGVLGLLAGRYGHQLYRDLRPRLAWDPVAGTVQALPGLRPLALRGAGTIPDRGLYPVVLQGTEVQLGEVDEEFAFERRPGDAFVLGTGTWRITAITPQRVEVVPAPGSPALVPFWHGEAPGRSYPLGQAVGRLVREVAERLDDPGLLDWLQESCCLDGRAAAQVRAWVADLQAHLGEPPSDQVLVLEWFRDELGGVRVALHSPFGRRVHAAWALALRRRLRQALGVDVQPAWGDDGLLLRLPPLEGEPPLALLAELGPDEAEELLLAELAESPLLGAYFRMAAEVALVLPRRRGGARTPLWLQRLKAKDLLEAVRPHRDFPLLIEAYRDLLHTRLDLAGLQEVLGRLAAGRLRLRLAPRATPSPAAAGLLFAFTMGYLYEDDAPRAERAAATLALDRSLLLEVLQRAGSARHLLDAGAVAEVVAELQHTAPGRQARSPDHLAQLLQVVGDLDEEEVAARCAGDGPGWLGALAAGGRAVPLDLPGGRRWIAAGEQPLYAAAQAGDEAAREALLRRFAQTHGPFTPAEVAYRYGWDPAWVEERLARWAAQGQVAAGALGPGGSLAWCDLQVLERIRRRTLAQARQAVRPVSAADYARFLWRWQGCREPAGGMGAAGVDGPSALDRALRPLQGVWLPAPLWEREVLPRRVPGYQPLWLDQLLASGQWLWAAREGKLAFFAAEEAVALGPNVGSGPAMDAPPAGSSTAGAGGGALSPLAQQVLAALVHFGASFLGPLALRVGRPAAEVLEALWELVWRGWVSNDTFAPLREHLRRRGPGAERASRGHGSGLGGASRATLAGGTGRWWALPWAPVAGTGDGEARPWTDRGSPAGEAPVDGATGGEGSGGERAARLAAWAALLLDRWGVVGREMVAAEDGAPAWRELLPVYRQWELQGRVCQGYFVAGLSGLQFARPQVVERLRDQGAGVASGRHACQLVPVAEPANPYGAVLPVPVPPGLRWRLARVPGSYLVWHEGRPVLAVEGYGHRLVPLAEVEEDLLLAALATLAQLLRPPGRERPVRRIEVAWWADRPVLEAPAAQLLLAVGFRRDYRSLVLRAVP